MPFIAVRSFLCFFCLVFVMRGSAQAPLIVKDYNNCTVGLQEKTGRWIVQPVYTNIEPFVGNFAIVQKNNLYGLINIQGIEVIKPAWDYFEHVHETGNRSRVSGLYLARMGNYSSSVLDTNGRVLLSCPYLLWPNFRDSVTHAYDGNNKSHFVHLNGTIGHAPERASRFEQIGFRCFSFTIDSLVQTSPRPENARRRSFTGVVNSEGKIIVPPRYEKVEWSKGNGYAMFEVRSGLNTGYYTPEGKQLWDCKYTYVQSLFSSYQVHLWDGPCIARLEDKWGVMSPRGDTILPFIYTAQPQAMISGTWNDPDTLYVVLLNEGYGIVNGKNEWIVPAIYQSIVPFIGSPSFNYGSFPNLYCACLINNKWGCISTNGEEILPPVYDAIQQYGTPEILFWSPTEAVLIQHTLTSGVCGATQEQFEARQRELDTIVYTGEYPESPDGLTYYHNEEWEDHYLNLNPAAQSNNRKKYRKINPYPYVFTQPSVPCLVYVRLDTVAGNKPGFTTYLEPASKDPEEENRQTIRAVVQHDSSGKVRCYIPQGAIGDACILFGRDGVLAPDGRVIIAPGIYMRATRAGTMYSGQDSTGSIVFIDSTGNVVWKTNSKDIHVFSGDTVWLAHYPPPSVNEDERQYSECDARWSLVDLTRRTALFDTGAGFTKPFYKYRTGGWQTTTVTGNGYVNTTSLKTYVKPEYKIVFPLNASHSYFAVTTCTNKTGIVDSNNVMLADTAFKSIIRIKAPRLVRKGALDSIPPGEDDLYLLISSNNTVALFSSISGTRMIDRSLYGMVLETIAVQSYNNLHPLGKMKDESFVTDYQCTDCPQRLYKSPGDTLLQWQSDYLFPLMFFDTRRLGTYDHFHFQGANRCHCQPDLSYERVESSRTNYFAMHPIVLHTVKDSVLSMTILPQNYNEDHWIDHRFVYRNLVQFPGGTREMTLDSLFKGEAWRSIITDSVLGYLRAHKDIDADCSKPELFSKAFNQLFLIRSDGLYLYPKWFRKTDGTPLSERPVIVIPWSVLEPHLRADVKSKIISADE